MEAYAGEMFKSDASLFPSYTRLVVPYRVTCRQRYYRMAKVYRNQFLKEHRTLELLQPRALDGIKLHREFCNSIIGKKKPKSPLEREKNLIELTPKEKRRLAYLLENPQY